MRAYKYRGGPRDILTRDLRSLYVDEIYAAPIHSLNDPHEARILIDHIEVRVSDLISNPEIAFSEKALESEKSFQNELRSLLERIRCCGIYSLSSTYDSELLWAYYGDSHRGFCVEYDFDRLIEHHLRNEFSLDVQYQDKVPSIHSANIPELMGSIQKILTRLVAIKSSSWKHESEIRIVTNEPGLYNYDYRAVTGIYFGCRCDEQHVKIIMRLLAGRAIKYYQMSPSRDSYSYEATQIIDNYQDRPRYRESLALVVPGVPFIGPDEESFKDELREAVETVRRDPYCTKVLDASISVYEEDSNGPSIFVTYEGEDGVARNKYFAVGELRNQTEF